MAQDSENRLPELRSGEVHWLLGSGELEDDDALGLEEGEVVEDSQLAADMLQWFTDGGGQLRYVEADDDATELSATEPLSDNELIIKMPLKLSLSQISARNIKTRSGYLGHHMKDIFKMNQVSHTVGGLLSAKIQFARLPHSCRCARVSITAALGTGHDAAARAL